ncbi:unnamed protein product [Durusdinium trenchii]
MVQQNLTAFSHSVDLRGPLTKDITAESFSERLVPFTLTTWLCLLFLYLIFFAHEMYAARVKPLWANEQKASSLMFQSSVLFYWFYWYVNEAMLLPVTLDFAVSMGQSATMSGFFISSSLIALILGLFMGKKLVPEASFDQRRARSLLVWSNLVATLFMLLEAAVCNSAVHWSMPAKGVVFWVMILISQAHGFVGALPYVPLMVMWGKFTPKSEMSFWMILTQCVRQSGLLVGPAIFALVSVLVKGGSPIAPPSLMAWVVLAQAVLGLASVLLNALVIPQQMPPLPDADADDAEEPEDVTLSNDPKTERSVEELELPQRQEVVQGMIFYAFERQLVTASIEVSTIMLLEVSYGWSVELSGIVFTVVSFTGLAFAGLSTWMISHQVCQESTVFFACNAIALVGVIFLFDFGTGAFGLLLADGLVYGCASVSNGIAEGWASRAAKEGSDFSIEVYRTWNMSLACAARFMAPMVARTVLDFGGRNLYAALQLVMVALSTSTVYKVVSMTWDLSHEVTQNGKESGKEV